MSAVEAYRKEKVYLAEVCAAGTLEDLADAAVAELEAKLEKANRRKANTEWNALVRQSDENLARAEQAEAERDALRDLVTRIIPFIGGGVSDLVREAEDAVQYGEPREGGEG